MGAVSPTRDDPFVAGASGLIGGPVGEHAATERDFFTPLRVTLLAASAMVMAGWWLQQRCDSSINGGERARTACPVVPPGGRGWERPEVALAVTVAVSGLAVLVTIWAVVALRRHRPWDAALVSIAPAVALATTLSWDFLAVSLGAAALVAWSRRRMTIAGGLIGASLTISWFCVAVFAGIWLLSKRKRQPYAWQHLAASVGGSWTLLNLPWLVVNSSSWWQVHGAGLINSAGAGSVWDIGARWPIGSGIPGLPSLAANDLLVSIVALVALGVCCVAIGMLGLRAPRSPRLAVVVFLFAAAVALTGTSWSLQYSLFLVPLVALARPKWRLFLAWQIAEVFYFLAYVLHGRYEATGAISLINHAESVPPVTFVIAAIVRWLMLAVLCVAVVQEVLRPKGDAIRNGPCAQDDPDGGVLNDPTFERRGWSWRAILAR